MKLTQPQLYKISEDHATNLLFALHYKYVLTTAC